MELGKAAWVLKPLIFSIDNMILSYKGYLSSLVNCIIVNHMSDN